MKIFISNDFFSHSHKDTGTYHLWAFELIKSAIIRSGIKSNQINILHEDSDISFSLLSEGAYDILLGDKLVKAKNHMQKVLRKYDLIILFEPTEETKNFVSSLGKEAIYFYISPIRFAKDVFFSLKSTSSDIQNKLDYFNIDKNRIKDLAIYWKNLIIEKEGHGDFKEGSSLLVGQVRKDLSVWNGDKMLSFNDFQESVFSIARTSSHIYYKAHPLDNSGHNDFLKNLPYVIHINENIYKLLSSKNIANIYAISSSVIEEAKYFEKNAKYLYKPFFNENNDYITIDSTIFSSNFWSVIVRGDTPKNYKSLNDIYIRPFRNMYWAYPYLESLNQFPSNVSDTPNQNIQVKKIENKYVSKFKRSCAKRIKRFKNPKKENDDVSGRGERQASKELSGIRKDHTQRYDLASEKISQSASILDIACGTGYGSYILSQKKHRKITSVDISKDAIKFARKYYNRKNINYIENSIELYRSNEKFEAIISYETIEHLEDPYKALKSFAQFLKSSGTLYVSFPNEDCYPFNKERNPHHKQHFTVRQMEQLLCSTGFRDFKVYYQHLNNSLWSINSDRQGALFCIIAATI